MIYRHLRDLAQHGWRVTVSPPAVSVRPLPPGHGLDILPLPTRKPWWPPASSHWPPSKRFRAYLWYLATRRNRNWNNPTPNCVLSVLWGYATLTAAHLARYWDVPLAIWVHDLFREMDLPRSQAEDFERLTTMVLRRADRVWTVSEELAADFAPRCRPGVVRALTPIPEQDAAPPGGWQPQFLAAPVIAHAGAFHSYHVPYLVAVARSASRRGGSLLVITPADNPALAQLRDTGVPFRHQPAFDSSANALAFLISAASAMTIMFPFEKSAYRHPPVGFPSRLIEFSRLGLPILLAAPSDNPLIGWGRRHSWSFRLEQPDWSVLDSLIAQLAQRETWQAMSSRMQSIAAAVCNPTKIHRQFRDELPLRHPSPWIHHLSS